MGGSCRFSAREARERLEQCSRAKRLVRHALMEAGRPDLAVIVGSGPSYNWWRLDDIPPLADVALVARARDLTIAAGLEPGYEDYDWLSAEDWHANLVEGWSLKGEEP